MTLDEMIEAGARGHFNSDWREDWTVQNEVRKGSYRDQAKVVLEAAGVPALLAERDALLERVRTLEAAAKAVEEWWLRSGQHQFMGAPACIFMIREAIPETNPPPPT